MTSVPQCRFIAVPDPRYLFGGVVPSAHHVPSVGWCETHQRPASECQQVTQPEQAKSFVLTPEHARSVMEVARVCIAARRNEFGRVSLDWEPYTCTFVVMAKESLVCAGKDLQAAVQAYNREY